MAIKVWDGGEGESESSESESDSFCVIVGCSNTSKRIQDMSFYYPFPARSLASAHTPRPPRTDKTCSSKPSWLSILDILAAWLCNSCQ